MQAIFYFAICSRTYSVGAVEIREIKMSKFDGLKKKMCNNKPRVYWNPATVKKTVGFFLGGGRAVNLSISLYLKKTSFNVLTSMTQKVLC